MMRWRRRLAFGVALLATALIVRAAMSLWPPSLRVAPSGAMLAGVTIINPGLNRLENRTMTIRNGRIESLRTGIDDATLLPRWRRYRGRYVLPGLIDLDVRHLPAADHLQRLFGVFFLYGGVTTVRVTGDPMTALRELQENATGGAFPWPRLFACGGVLEGDPPACAQNRIVRDPTDAVRAVADVAARGASCVAVGRTLDAETLGAVRAAAAANGLTVVGDVRADAAPAGAERDERRLVAFETAALRALPPTAAAPGASYIPQVFRWSRLGVRPEELANDPHAPFMPRIYPEVIWRRELAQLAGGEAAAGSVELMRAAQRLRDAGVSIHLGSGTPAAFVSPASGLLRELGALAAAGYTLEQLWAAATRGAGAALGVPQLGMIEDGAPADLLVFRDDPTRDPAAFLTLEAVVTQGRLYPQTVLVGYLLEWARYVHGPLYDPLAMAVARVGTWWRGDDMCEWP